MSQIKCLLLSAGIAAMLVGCSDMDLGAEELDHGALAEASSAVTAASFDPLSADLLGDVSRVFPDGQSPVANDIDFIDSLNVWNPNVIVEADNTEVFVTLVRRDSAYDNGLAFYTHPNWGPPGTPPSYTVIWNNTAGLPAGTRVSLGKFNANTRIAFVLLVGNGSNPQTKYYSTGLLNSDGIHFVTKYHLLEKRFIIGMEDKPLGSTGDTDDNDLIISVTKDPSGPPPSGPDRCDGKDNNHNLLVDEWGCRTGINRYVKPVAGGSIHHYNTTAPAGFSLEIQDYFYVANISPRTKPLYQCSANGAYLYTTSPTCELLQKQPDATLGYIGDPAATQPPGSVPLYRAFSQSTQDHFYTASLEEYNGALQGPWGYQPEGILGYVWLTAVP